MRAQVLAVVIAKVVVASDRDQLDAGVDEKIHESGFHFCLARFEIISPNEGSMLLGKLNGPRHKSVLW